MGEQLHFDIDASVVFQLGEDLITDEIQALVELVKNSYDADASYCVVTVDTTAEVDEGPRRLRGLVSVEDNGTGMDREDIRRGWLTISKSPKRLMKSQGLTTGKGRTPLGDKGLGRLGAQRLGNHLRIRTRPRGANEELAVEFDWRDFKGEALLTQVPVTLQVTPTKRASGSVVEIRDLVAPGEWAEPALLQRELSRMLAPHQVARDFELALEVDGEPLDLYEVIDAVRDLAQVRYRLVFDGHVLSILGKAKLEFVRGRQDEEFRQLCEFDRGKRLWEYLANLSRTSGLGIRWSPDPRAWVEFESKRALSDIPGVAMTDGHPASPGPFEAEIDVFSLAQEDWQEGVFDRLSDYRQYVRSRSGIGIYRDGFGIRMPDDWLGLARLQTKGTSFYGLRPENIVGHVALSAEKNSQLTETTDREGFIASAFYRNFEMLLSEVFVQYSGNVQEHLRRGYNDFRRKIRADVELDVGAPGPEKLIADVSSVADESRKIRKPVERLKGKLDELGDTRPRADDEGRGTARQPKIDELLVQTQAQLAEVEAFLGRIEELQATSSMLDFEVAQLREQVALSYETMSLGLTAEALLHEFANIGDRLRRRSAGIDRHLKDIGIDDPAISGFVREVRSVAAAIRRQVARVSPSLRYVRERRESISMRDFLQEASKTYRDRWSEKPISVVLTTGESDFTINMNRGKLGQIFDNLLLNSEYWISHRMRTEQLSIGRIELSIEKPFVAVCDNAGGIDPTVESSLFEPFVTSKPPGSGRGLGLFVITQLLDSEGCSIFLDHARNEVGRRDKFVLDFAGALAEDES